MAIRREDLTPGTDAAVLSFPTGLARRRAARQMRVVYLRRRMALAGIFVLVVAGWLLAGGVGNSAIASRDGSPSRITLQSGQTLWDVADRYAPAGIDPRAYVDALLRMNNVEGAPQSGQRLRLPR